eukprot:6182154-Pleurochrysis_carterae.AAC.3
MTREQLLKAYARAKTDRNYAGRQKNASFRQLVVARAGSGAASSSHASPASSQNRPFLGAVRSANTVRDANSNNKVHTARRRRLFTIVQQVFARRPDKDIPHVLDMLNIQHLSTQQRARMRELLSVQQERFLEAKALCGSLRKKHFTPTASLTVRLEKNLSSHAIDRANSVLSKSQSDDGTWRRLVLLEAPAGNR